MITGKTLLSRGWNAGKLLGIALALAKALDLATMDETEILALLDRVRNQPGLYLTDQRLEPLARACLQAQGVTASIESDSLRDAPLDFPIWGQNGIQAEAIDQMRMAMRLPITVAGGLMADAHFGYGLPIGGVLGTRGAVVPYAVGLDIGCRMHLSLYPVSPIVLDAQPRRFREALMTQTHFGLGKAEWAGERPEHPIIDDARWQTTAILRGLRQTAIGQLGSSGTGNHFVEWGRVTVTDGMGLSVEPGVYLGLLSHSGSRRIGSEVASRYTKIAQEQHSYLAPEAQKLAWLDLGTEAGQEYWIGMTLAGDFAAANHAVIHQRVSQAAGLSPMAVIENFHNFAWMETGEDGAPIIVHRKGTTPAHLGTLGVIPGTSAHDGYLVRGRGNAASLNSASHGAGRAMSRKAATAAISQEARADFLAQRGVTMLGGGCDEAPQAYKDPAAVMAAQADLVNVLGTFTPKMCRMADSGEKSED